MRTTSLTLISLILLLASVALAQEVSLDISLPRNSLSNLVQALDGTTITYSGGYREDLQAARLFIGRARITRMEEGQILMGLEGRIWILYYLRSEEAMGIPLGKSLEVNTSVDFASELSLIPQLDESTKKLILKVNVLKLELKKAEGFYELLRQVPGIERVVRSEINKALQSMRLEILDLSPYLIPQEVALQESRWSADRTLFIEPVKVEIEVGRDALKVRAFARVQPRANLGSREQILKY